MIDVPATELSKIISIGLKKQTQTCRTTSTRILSVYVDVGSTGSRQGMLAGRFVRCRCWELKNAKSFPYVKEILKSRQHFLSLFIDNKYREKERGRF